MNYENLIGTVGAIRESISYETIYQARDYTPLLIS
jgi:hypothetical protein